MNDISEKYRENADLVIKNPDNKEIVLNAVKTFSSLLCYASDTLKDDKDVALAAISNDGDALLYVSDRLKDDRDVVLAAVTKYGHALRHASDTLKDDKEVVLAASRNFADAFTFASDRLKDDIDVLSATAECFEKTKHYNSSLQNYVLERLNSKKGEIDRQKNERDAIISELKLLDSTEEKDEIDLSVIAVAMRDAIDKFPNDKEIALIAVNNDGTNLEHVAPNLRDDEDVVLAALDNNVYSFKYASNRLKDDKNMILTAINASGTNFKYASDRLKNDKEVVLAAIRNCIYALKYASNNLKKDKEVLLESVRKNGMTIVYALAEVRSDLNYKDVAIEAIKQNEKVFLYLKDPLKSDPEIISYLSEKILARREKEILDNARVEERLQDSVEREKALAREKVKNNLEKIKAIQVVRYNGLALKNFPELNNDEEVVEAAVRANGRALEFASERLKDNERIALLAVSEDIRAFDFVSPRLKADPAFLKKYDYYKGIDDRKYTQMPELPNEDGRTSAFLEEYQEADLDKFISSLVAEESRKDKGIKDL